MIDMPVETVISLVVAVSALGFTALSFRRTVNKDTGASAAALATMKSDISYIKDAVDDIKTENKSIVTDISNLRTKLAEVEAAVKSAHKRIDDLMKG